MCKVNQQNAILRINTSKHTHFSPDAIETPPGVVRENQLRGISTKCMLGSLCELKVIGLHGTNFWHLKPSTMPRELISTHIYRYPDGKNCAEKTMHTVKAWGFWGMLHENNSWHKLLYYRHALHNYNLWHDIGLVIVWSFIYIGQPLRDILQITGYYVNYAISDLVGYVFDQNMTCPSPRQIRLNAQGGSTNALQIQKNGWNILHSLLDDKNTFRAHTIILRVAH